MTTRDEVPDDVAAIRAVHRAAFGGPLEAALVDRLRADRLVICSRVAVEADRVIGHVLFSPVWIEHAAARSEVASLAPVAVLPEAQRRGIGSRLIVEGIEVCRGRGWSAVVVVGHPEYYPRFGFAAERVRHLHSPYAGGSFLGLDLTPGAFERLSGRVRYPAPFDAL